MSYTIQANRDGKWVTVSTHTLWHLADLAYHGQQQAWQGSVALRLLKGKSVLDVQNVSGAYLSTSPKEPTS
jgi:hypothetical protein